MKTKLTLVLLILALGFVPYALSQTPQGINYQAIARDGSGAILDNKTFQVELTIQTSTGIPIWRESKSLTSNQFGLITTVLGPGPNLIGTPPTFAGINWKAQPLFLKTRVQYPGTTWNDMGTSQIWSVPYALVAKDVEGPLTKLNISGISTLPEETLFEVKNKNGEIIFAVYNEGVRVYVPEGAKGAKGGFAVSGFSSNKTLPENYLFVGPDSIRAYIWDDPAAKGSKGGFMVSGFNGAKNITNRFLDVSPDSVRIFIDNEASTKGAKGGFAVSGFNSSKNGTYSNYLSVETDTSYTINPSQPRILWYPLKNAFLTGMVSILYPDSVGINSFASGYESRAIGDWSQALGYKAVARGKYSTSIGKNSVTKLNNSFAFGNQARAFGEDSYALGTGAVASGSKSFALGSVGVDSTGAATGPTVASGEAAFALGFGSAASETGSFAIGVQDSASGPFSLSMGYLNRARAPFSTTLGVANIVEANGWNSLATGIWTKAGNWASSSFGDRSYAKGHTSFATGFTTVASGQLSATFGDQTVAPSYGSFAIGRYNAYSGSATGWNSADPLFMVGIGTSPAARTNAFTVFKNGNIDVAGSSLLSNTYILSDCIELNEEGTGNRNAYIDFHGDDTYSDYGFRILRTNTGPNAFSALYHRGTGNFSFIAREAAPMIFYTNNTERFRIASNGWLGINTSSPAFLVDAAGSMNLNKGISSLGALFVDSDEAIWYNGTYFSWGFGATYNYFADKVTIGNAANPGYMLYVQGTAYSTGTWAGSDARWKRDLEPVTNQLPKLMQLNSFTFNWKTEEFPDMKFEGDRQLGLIAQEVESLFPELVRTDSEGYKAVSYEKLSVLLLSGMKEQQSQIEIVKTENELLKEEVEEMKQAIEELRKVVLNK